jgi:hypothetical protein
MTETQIRRIYDFLAAMELAPACHSREEAFALVQKIWLNVNTKFATADQAMRNFSKLSLKNPDEWQDLDKDPCYLNNIDHSELRLYLHLDGTIVIQEMRGDFHAILLNKQGAYIPMIVKLPELP